MDLALDLAEPDQLVELGEELLQGLRGGQLGLSRRGRGLARGRQVAILCMITSELGGLTDPGRRGAWLRSRPAARRGRARRGYADAGRGYADASGGELGR